MQQLTVKKTRQLLGITQAKLAKLMGVTPQRISSLENKTEGRSETKKDKQFLKAIIVLHRNGLLSDMENFEW